MYEPCMTPMALQLNVYPVQVHRAAVAARSLRASWKKKIDETRRKCGEASLVNLGVSHTFPHLGDGIILGADMEYYYIDME